MGNEDSNTFANVDRASDPQSFVQCMHDQYASNQKLAQNKDATFELMALQAGQRVLDVGCGTGVDALRMAESVAPDGHVYGVDLSQAMILEAEKSATLLNASITFNQGSIYDLSFDDDYFDRCRADKTLQHLADPLSAVRELIRVTKPGGKIVIADPDNDSLIIDTPYPDITNRFVRFRSERMAQGGIAHQLFRIFKELGLEDVTVLPQLNVYTNYEEKKAESPYLREIWIAQKQGVIDENEAEQWAEFLQNAIDNGRFFCMQTYVVTVGTKPKK